MKKVSKAWQLAEEGYQMAQKERQTTHTPTPWEVMNGVQITTIDTSAGCIATTHKNAHRDSTPEVDAAFIVRAVNSHEALLEAAKAMQITLAMDGKSRIAWDKAIAQAEGKA